MKRRWNRKFLSGAACCLLMGIGAMAAGFQDSRADLEPVEVVHVVKPQETLWGISAFYHKKDVGRDTYLMEFKDEIMERNPWLEERKGQIHPGDAIHIVYYEKKPASAATDTDL